VVLGAAAWRTGDATFRIAAFRDDPKDGSAERVNQDQYDVWLTPKAHPDFLKMVAQASTCCNGNMDDFCDVNIAFTKRRTGDGFVHRLSDVPAPFDIIFQGHE